MVGRSCFRRDRGGDARAFFALSRTASPAAESNLALLLMAVNGFAASTAGVRMYIC